MFRVGGWPVCQIRTTCRQHRFKGTATSKTAWRGSHDCWCRILATLPEQARGLTKLNSKSVAAMVLVLDRTTDIQNMCWEVVDNYIFLFCFETAMAPYFPATTFSMARRSCSHKQVADAGINQHEKRGDLS